MLMVATLGQEEEVDRILDQSDRIFIAGPRISRSNKDFKKFEFQGQIKISEKKSFKVKYI